MNGWEVLGISPTSDKKIVKRAYAKEIKKIDAVLEPEDFQAIREAYEHIMQYGLEEEKGNNTRIVEREFDLGQPQLVYPHDAVNDSITNDKVGNNDASTIEETTIVEFLDKIDILYSGNEGMELELWNKLLVNEEIEFITVKNILRFDVFHFFLNKLAERKIYHFRKEKKKIRRLPKNFKKVIESYANFFDWQGHELSLTSYFSLQQMQLMNYFILPYQNSPPLDTPLYNPIADIIEEKPTSKLIWPIAIAIIFSVKFLFGLYEEHRNGLFTRTHNETTSSRSNYEDSESYNRKQIKNDRDYCLSLQTISNERDAYKCYMVSEVGDGKLKFIIADYGIRQKQSLLKPDINEGVSFFHRESIIEDELLSEVILLEEAVSSGYSPAYEKLADLYLDEESNIIGDFVNKFYRKAIKLGSETAKLKLGCLYVLATLGISSDDNMFAGDYFDSIDISQLTPTQKLVLFTATYLEHSYIHDRQSALESIIKVSSSANARYILQIANYLSRAINDDYNPNVAIKLIENSKQLDSNNNNYIYSQYKANVYAVNEMFEKSIEYQIEAIQKFEEAIKNKPKMFSISQQRKEHIFENEIRLELQYQLNNFKKNKKTKRNMEVTELELILKLYIDSRFSPNI